MSLVILYETPRLLVLKKWIIDLYQNYTDSLIASMQENRPRIGDLPICGPTFEEIEHFRT